MKLFDRNIAATPKRMTISDRQQVLSNVIIAVSLAIVLIIVMFSNSLTKKMVKSKEEEYNGYAQTLGNYEKEKKTVENLVSTVEGGGIPNSTRELITQKEFVDFVGETCERYDLQLNKLMGGRISKSTGKTAIDFSVEVQGKSKNVQKFLSALNNLPAISTVKSASYRNDANQEWMERATDEKKLLEWWSIKSEEKKNSSNGESAPIGIETMMESSDMKLYLNIQFIKLS